MKRKEDNVVLLERDGSSSVVWFLVGGALGAGLALLFAPHSGDRTRRLLSRRLGKLRDAADQALSDLKEAVTPAENGPDDLEEEAEEEESPGDRKGEPDGDRAEEPPARRGVAGARRELEQRLAEARARRHKALAEEDEEPIA